MVFNGQSLPVCPIPRERIPHCLKMMNDRTIDTPEIKNKAIKPILGDREHFVNNDNLVKILSPVVDAIARLEFASTNLGDIWKELLTTYHQVKAAEVGVRFTHWSIHAGSAIDHRAQTFDLPIYRVAFFLSPRLRRVALPLNTTLVDMQKDVLRLAQNWGFKKSELVIIKEQTRLYYNNLPPYNSIATQDAFQYWTELMATEVTGPLKRFCCILFEVVVHAAGVEGLFSMMAATKTK
ncbi:hypothetical protein DFS34DRAFT_706791 [Phlyctochytrium arcticum]|nr:hypothetical protein DFS34DRAFT_706791 [Phlyctochytrium arcticum]